MENVSDMKNPEKLLKIIENLKNKVEKVEKERDSLQEQMENPRPFGITARLDFLLRDCALSITSPFSPEEVRSRYNTENGKNISRGAIGNVLRWWKEIGYIEKLKVDNKEIRGFYVISKKK